MNCPQEECEGCPRLSECDRTQAWDYRAELDAEERHDPVTDRLDELEREVQALKLRVSELRLSFERVIAAVRKATVEEVE